MHILLIISDFFFKFSGLYVQVVVSIRATWIPDITVALLIGYFSDMWASLALTRQTTMGQFEYEDNITAKTTRDHN